MASVHFIFREHASEEAQERIGDQIRGLPGVKSVARLKPDAKKPMLRRFWYANVADDNAASALVEHLRGRSDIESADVPAPRAMRLPGGPQ
jgi:hypothetical protein